MKPLLIKLRNIGPFVNEQIDFSKLENMFLITGNTGAGKTFIFDAMTFALYGSVCGSRGEESNQLRSKYTDVKDDSEAFVEFSFESAGKIYRVNRTLSYKYVNKNNKEATKDSVVVFEQYNTEQKSFVSFDEQKSQIDARIQSIIGLKKDEFSKIILLPQGAFSSFLKENSKDKAETLKKIFPVDSYTSIMEDIREKAKNLKNELDAINNQITNLCQKCDFSEGDKFLEELKVKKEEIENKQKNNSHELQIIVSDITKLNEEKTQAKEKNEHSEKLNNLLSKKEFYEHIEEKIKKAEKSSVFGEFIRNVELCKKNYEKAKIDFEESKENLNFVSKKYDEIFQQENDFAVLKAETKKMQSEFSVLEEQLKNAKELAFYIEKTQSEKQKLEKLKEELNKIDCEITENKNKVNSELAVETVIEQITIEISNLKIKVKDDEQKLNDFKSLQKIIKEIDEKQSELRELNLSKDSLVKNIENNRKILDETLIEQKNYEKKNASYELAKDLQEGQECPVCGSLNHPKLACSISGLSYSDKISTYEQNLKISQEKAIEIEAQISSVATLISEKSIQKKELEAQSIVENICEIFENDKVSLEKKEEDIQFYKKIKENLELLEEKYKAKRDEIMEQDKIYSSCLATQKEKENNSLKGLSLEELTKKHLTVQKELEDSELKINKWENDCKNIASEKKACEVDNQTKSKYFADSSKNLDHANAVLSEKVSSSEFNNLEEVISCFVEENELVKIKNDLKEYSVSVVEHSAVLEKYKNIRMLSEIETDLQVAQNKKNEMDIESQNLNNDFQKIIENYTNFESSFEQYKTLENQRKTTEQKRLPYEKLNNDLNGNNPKKLQFDSWVLGIYFEQVVTYASKRFYDISNGRYNFKIANYENGGKGNSKKGLDLLVIDSFNGSERPTSTLSGGETFMASISLALALTDVVQNLNGGIQLDSLFIDEGFGTLDNETLDKALGVLNELQETKMVGIISHVDALQSTIPSIIKVEKTQNGSHIKILD
ncbi:MAG: AAA family ATPase [Treponema sp.]|nr:AAA family ATPase [Treponema sp.]